MNCQPETGPYSARLERRILAALAKLDADTENLGQLLGLLINERRRLATQVAALRGTMPDHPKPRLVIQEKTDA